MCSWSTTRRPTFIVYAANDAVVPVENAYRLHKALLAKGGAAELHVFADAPHGFALREKELPVGVADAVRAVVEPLNSGASPSGPRSARPSMPVTML